MAGEEQPAKPTGGHMRSVHKRSRYRKKTGPRKRPNRPLSPDEAGFRRVTGAAQNWAESRDLRWKLTDEEVKAINRGDCHYCGAPPSNVCAYPRKSGDVHYVYSGLDRLDNSVGYVRGNVVPSCRLCNTAKNTLSVAEFADLVKRIAAHLSKWDHGPDAGGKSQEASPEAPLRWFVAPTDTSASSLRAGPRRHIKSHSCILRRFES